MGVSFKVSKTGTRFRPKPVLAVQAESGIDDVSENSKESSVISSKNESAITKIAGNVVEDGKNVLGVSSSSISGLEVSFTLNLYPDGYSIGNPSQDEAALQDSQKLLHPYDRTSETLFSAIESGLLPGDILDDIPCKYVNGTLICEVRDFRKCAPEHGSSIPSSDEFPIVTKLCLRLSLENVVKDIPFISDNSWTYGDLMEVESRILKALQPQLCLDPSPKLDRLYNNPFPSKLNLALSSLWRKRRQTPEITVSSNNRTHGKRVCIDQAAESSNSRFGDSSIVSGNVMPQHVQENMTAQNLSPSSMLALRARSFVQDGNVPALPLMSQQARYHMGVGTPRSMQDQGSGSLVGLPGASPSGQDMMMPYGDSVNSNAPLNGKRESQDGQMSPLSSFSKRPRHTPVVSDGIQQQIGTHIDGVHSSDINWKSPLVQQQAMARGIQFPNAGLQKYPQHMFEGVMNQNAGPGMGFGPKEEQFETEKLDGSESSQGKSDIQMMETEIGHLDMQQLRMQQRLPPHIVRSNYPHAAWNNVSQDSRKEEPHSKRKSGQSPRLSAGALAQSPLPSKSGDMSTGSAGPHFGVVAAASALGLSQKEKSGVTAIGGTPSLTSSGNDSFQRQHLAQAAAKRRSNSLPKTPVMSNVGSPASVSNISVVPLNASSPSIGTPSLADQTLLDRFGKIETVTMRYQLNCKKHKVDDYSGRKSNHSPQLLTAALSNLVNSEELKDENSRRLSKSVVGGNINVCKMRVMNFVLAERVLQGNHVSFVPRIRTRMIMSEKPNDGTVVMHYGETEDADFLSAEDHLPTLANTHFADLLASQFCSLMIRDGFIMEDHIQPRPIRMNIAPSNVTPNSQQNAAGISPNNSTMEVQQYNDTVSGQPSNDVKPTLTGNNSSPNLLANQRMLPPGNHQALQTSQGLMAGGSLPARTQLLDPQSQLQQQQLQPPQQQNQHPLIHQQHPQFQRSQVVLPSNPLSQFSALGQNSNMQLGSHMVGKHSSLQLQLLQQQQQQQEHQQQQQSQMQHRKMVMGLGPAMGMGNNMAGLGGLSNPIGVGGSRGIGSHGISGPMATISGISNVGQNPLNLSAASSITSAISQQLRSGQITPQQATLLSTKIRMAQSRSSVLGGPQSGITGMSAGRQMHPASTSVSMLNQCLSRASMNQMQRSALGPMGPPRLMAEMNLYMNQQQQQQLQLQQQQQQQLLLQPLQQQQQHQQHQQQHHHQQQQQQQQQLQQQQHQQQQQQQQQQQHQQQQQQLPLLQQQESTASLQAVVSPSRVGSPSTMGIPQMNQQSLQQQPLQQPSPQQISQRTPMSPQLSSGVIHPTMSAGNTEACPASPQLSSQTLGSVGSITNSPMELQGVNKSNSGNNA